MDILQHTPIAAFFRLLALGYAAAGMPACLYLFKTEQYTTYQFFAFALLALVVVSIVAMAIFHTLGE